MVLSREAAGAHGRKPEPVLEGVVDQPSPAPSADALCSFFTYIFLSTCASVQEKKFQDLEVELETRTKDVKARLAQLDIQVRQAVGVEDRISRYP